MQRTTLRRCIRFVDEHFRTTRKTVENVSLVGHWFVRRSVETRRCDFRREYFSIICPTGRNIPRSRTWTVVEIRWKSSTVVVWMIFDKCKGFSTVILLFRRYVDGYISRFIRTQSCRTRICYTDHNFIVPRGIFLSFGSNSLSFMVVNIRA